jgi:hypothetical protein
LEEHVVEELQVLWMMSQMKEEIVDVGKHVLDALNNLFHQPLETVGGS